MKILIDFNGVKREIDGPFWICGNRVDIATMQRTLYDAIEAGHEYGWIAITDNPPLTANTPPIKWTER